LSERNSRVPLTKMSTSTSFPRAKSVFDERSFISSWDGQRFRDPRTILNGVFWNLCSGAAWRDLPKRYGPLGTVYSRFRRWSRAG